MNIMSLNQSKHFNAKKVFVDWLIHWQIRPMSSMKQFCASFLNTEYFHMDDSNKAFDRNISTPLLRMGIMEFAGEDKYYISDPVMIYNQYTQYSILFRAEHLNNSIALDLGIALEPYLRVDTGKIRQYENIYIENGYKSYLFKPAQVLSNFPSIDKIISSFNEAYLISASDNYLYFKDNNWEKAQVNNNFGVAKKSQDDHNKYFIYPNNTIKEIPSRSQNPEAFVLANAYQNILKKKRMEYNSKLEVLLLPDLSCPSLLFRVLSLNMLLFGDNIPTDNKFTHVSKQMYKEINRIFNNAIIER